jgi:hypothetical protein
MINRLGTESDSAIARRYGISNTSVAKKRSSLGIEAAHPAQSRKRGANPFWTPEFEALLGTESDQKIADHLGVPHGWVASRRRALEIPPANPRKYIDWRKIDPLLGTASDAALASRFGVDEDSVRRRRLNLKIPPFRKERRTLVRTRKLRDLVRKPTQHIEEVSASAVASLRQELGVPSPPRVSRWTPELLERLWSEPDEVVAEEQGISVDAVRRIRTKHGIRVRPVRPRWTQEEKKRLTEIDSDRDAALQLGRSVKAVRHMRSRLKIGQRTQ